MTSLWKKKWWGGRDKAASCFLYWRRGKGLHLINWWSVNGDAWSVFSGLLFWCHTTNWVSAQKSGQSFISFCSKTSSWILNFNLLFPLKAMTLVTLLGNTFQAPRNKRKQERERQEKCAEPYNSIWASDWNIFLSNKLAARVVSKIVLIVFVLWSVPNILETHRHFLNLWNPQSSIWLSVYKYIRPSITYTWESASP